MVKAVINGDRIECGACGALLAKLNNGIVDKGKYESEISKQDIEIKCTHKDKGKKCGEINTIEL
jgi:hypothetical protein